MVALIALTGIALTMIALTGIALTFMSVVVRTRESALALMTIIPMSF